MISSKRTTSKFVVAVLVGAVGLVAVPTLLFAQNATTDVTPQPDVQVGPMRPPAPAREATEATEYPGPNGQRVFPVERRPGRARPSRRPGAGGRSAKGLPTPGNRYLLNVEQQIHRAGVKLDRWLRQQQQLTDRQRRQVKNDFNQAVARLRQAVRQSLVDGQLSPREVRGLPQLTRRLLTQTRQKYGSALPEFERRPGRRPTTGIPQARRPAVRGPQGYGPGAGGRQGYGPRVRGRQGYGPGARGRQGYGPRARGRQGYGRSTGVPGARRPAARGRQGYGSGARGRRTKGPAVVQSPE